MVVSSVNAENNGILFLNVLELQSLAYVLMMPHVFSFWATYPNTNVLIVDLNNFMFKSNNFDTAYLNVVFLFFFFEEQCLWGKKRN